MLTQALLVDDSRSALDFLKRHVEADGTVQVTAFTDPLQAIAFAMQRAYDLVLVDYEMPKMDGISFIARLRQQESSLASIPAVVASTEAGKKDRESARAAGANYYVVKPVTRDVLLRLCALLSGRTR